MDSTLKDIFSNKTSDGKKIITLYPKTNIKDREILRTIESKNQDPLYFLQKSNIFYKRAQDFRTANEYLVAECKKEITVMDFLIKSNTSALNYMSSEDIDPNNPNIFVKIAKFIVDIVRSVIAFVENVIRSIINFFKYLALWRKNQAIAHQSIYRRYKKELHRADLSRTIYILPYNFSQIVKNINDIFERIRRSDLLKFLDTVKLDAKTLAQQIDDCNKQKVNPNSGIWAGNEINITNMQHIRSLVTEILYFGADLERANGKWNKQVSVEDQIREKLDNDFYQKYKDPSIKIEVPLSQVLTPETIQVLEDSFLATIEAVTRHTNAILDKTNGIQKSIKAVDQKLKPFVKNLTEMFSSVTNRSQLAENIKGMADTIGDLFSLITLLLTGIRFTSFYTTTTALKFRSDIFKAFEDAVRELDEIDQHIATMQPGDVDDAYNTYKKRENIRFGEYRNKNMNHLTDDNMYINQLDEATQQVKTKTFFGKTMDFFGFGKKK